MKLGIIGLPQSGKTTVFEALTKNISESAIKVKTASAPSGCRTAALIN